jgi:para-nitrobenzyl esterase
MASQPGLKGLRAISSADLQKATGQGLSFLGPELGVVVDGWVFPESPMKVFAAGKEHRVDLLLGSNARELQRPFFPMSGALAQAIQEQYGPLAGRALAVYGLNGGPEPQPDPLLGTVMAQWATDSQFRCGTVAELVWHTGAGNPGYQFQFARAAPGRETVGAAHGSHGPAGFGRDANVLDELRENRRPQRRRPAAMAEVRPCHAGLFGVHGCRAGGTRRLAPPSVRCVHGKLETPNG